jgi:hypothetical protein
VLSFQALSDMAIMNLGGAILPGFDCETGKAIGLNASEWQHRIKGMKIIIDYFTLNVRVYEGEKLRYEIYALESELI